MSNGRKFSYTIINFFHTASRQHTFINKVEDCKVNKGKFIDKQRNDDSKALLKESFFKKMSVLAIL